MMRERIRSVGISILGGNSGFSGKYELGIDHIRIVNEEDVTDEPLEKVLASKSGTRTLCLSNLMSFHRREGVGACGQREGRASMIGGRPL